MKLVPDVITSALGKLLPFGGSDAEQKEVESAPATAPTETTEPTGSTEREPATGPFDGESNPSDSKPSDDSKEPEPERSEKSQGDSEAASPEGSASGGADAPTDEGKDGDEDGDGDGEEIDASDITAPSIGPNTVIHHKPPEERLDHDKISDTDILGRDKRREVVGQRYSASPARQVATYAIFVVVVVALAIGGKALATKLDKPPATVENRAPWTGTEIPVNKLDFPQYGEPAS